MSNDLSVNGPGSPVSLKKFLLSHETNKELTVLIDGTGSGIAHDDEGCLYITPEECKTQALHYSKNVFNGRQIPAYLYRYLGYMMIDGMKEYNSDQELAEAFQNGDITEESDDYKYLLNLITYCEHNSEAQQVIGLIQLIAGSLNIARKADSGLRLYIDRPETALHPKRQAKAMSLFMKLKSEYGWEDKPIEDEQE